MGLSSVQYRAQLQALLPRGLAWPLDVDAVLTKTLDSLAEEFARVHGRADDLLEEMDPRTTSEMLSDWERALGLPDSCTTAADTTVERRAAVFEKLTSIGGQSIAYYIAVAKALGFDITITEFDPFHAGSTAGQAAYGEDWQFAWQVNAPLDTITEFKAGSGAAGDKLRDWGNELLECAITRLKPAHTVVQFAYGG